MGVLTAMTFAAIFAEIVFVARARAAVPGSHQRYVALSLRRIATWSVITLFAVQGVLGLTAGDSSDAFSGLIYVAVAAWSAMSELRNHHDDDDWFNGRGKKIIAGIRRAFTPRAAHRPSFA